MCSEHSASHLSPVTPSPRGGGGHTKRRGGRSTGVRALATLGLCVGLPAYADNIDASATALTQGRQDPRDGQIHTVVPALALVSVRATDIQNPVVEDLSVVLSGWGGYQFGEPLGNMGEPVGRPVPWGDLDVAYIQGSEFDHHLTLRAGRQLVTGGSAQVLPIDGASVTISPAREIGVTVYGGELVVPRFASATGDAAGGARAWYRLSATDELGLSFVDVLENGILARQELGLDARFVPYRTLTFSGYALVSTMASRLAEADATITWQPVRALQLTADYRRTAPDLFISAASIFSVFAEERHDEVGGSAFWRISRWATLDGDFHGVYVEEGWGHRAQGRLKIYLGRERQANIGFEARELILPGNGYYEARAFGSYRFSPNVFATVDLDLYEFRAPINGQTSSYDGTLSAVYDVTPSWRVALSGVAATTPFLQSSTQIIARVVYSPSLTFREKTK